MKRYVALLMTILLNALGLQAQDMTGRVVDENGEALPGATIRLVRTKPRHEMLTVAFA